MALKECSICIEKFNISTRKEISCSACSHAFCRQCIETYILSSIDEPNCMNCKKGWSADFIRDKMTKSFCDTKLKKHREDILFEKEKSLLPATQSYIQVLLKKEKVGERISELWRIRNDIDKQIESEKKHLRDLDKPDLEVSKQKFIRACPMSECRGFLSTSYKCGTCNIWVCPDCKEIKGYNKNIEHTCDPEILKSVKAIESETKSCPNCAVSIYKIDGCFAQDTEIIMFDYSTKKVQDIQVNDVLLGHDGKARTVNMTMEGKDDLYRVRQSHGEAYIVNSKHKIVLVDTYSSAILLMTAPEIIDLSVNERSNLRGIRFGQDFYPKIQIEYHGFAKYYGFMVNENPLILLKDYTVVHNCNQFFCTACNTVFDWKTGKITVGGPVHNPHYFEWIRNNGDNVRQIGDVPCGGLPYIFRYTKVVDFYKDISNLLIDMYRITNEVIDWWVTKYPVTSSLQGNRDLRVSFLRNSISEEEFKRQLQIREKKIIKNTAIRQVLDTFVSVASENINAINEAGINRLPVEVNIEQMNKIREYTNTCLSMVGKKYDCTVPFIQTDWKKVITK
jgi:hypothetical protein